MNKEIIANWLPKAVQCLKGYTRADCAADVTAGLTVGLVALPLAMAGLLNPLIAGAAFPPGGTAGNVLAEVAISTPVKQISPLFMT